jgi:hypothetical protein
LSSQVGVNAAEAFVESTELEKLKILNAIIVKVKKLVITIFCLEIEFI